MPWLSSTAGMAELQHIDTPLMRQYLENKQRHPDALLLFRLGDFYELFFEDAVVASRTLGLTLTSRDKNKPDPVPMCGVPHHAAKGYIRRLLDAGFKVAVCEQVEDPRLARGLTRREVVEVITPGVVLDTDHLQASANNYLVALCGEETAFGIAAFDLSTFELRATVVGDVATATDELARLQPKEVVCAGVDDALRENMRGVLSGLWQLAQPAWQQGDDRADTELVTAGVDTPLEPDPVGAWRLARRAAALALRYAAATQPTRKLPACRFQLYRPTDYLQLDETTLGSLEILRSTAEGSRATSLLGVLDTTVTAMGARLLRQVLMQPLLDVAAIRRRQDAVELLLEQQEVRQLLREALRSVADIERLTARVVMGVASPREVVRLGGSLLQLPAVEALLASAREQILARELPELLTVSDNDLLLDVAERICGALREDAPPTAREGGVFRDGVRADLDELVALAEGGRSAIVEMEGALRERTGIASLKIRYNRVLGYYIEVTKANLRLVPQEFRRKQTLVNAERFVTPELADYETRVLSAHEQRCALESQLFDELLIELASHAPRLTRAAQRLALIDLLCALAEVAQTHDFTRPDVDDSFALDIEQGRHPVVERFMAAGQFVPNDLLLDGENRRLMVLTGPNMAGKSTAIRQTALIVLMAQAGAFVPCRRARLGLADRIFTRIGASDNIARGQSTFMVEMRETAGILRHATARSLVILDEIGRGTSTYDGLSIAWAVAEYLHDRVRARTLFATHYHELCQLPTLKPHACNSQVAVQEWEGRIIFLHRLIDGAASRSYGIEVARIAGLPLPVIDRGRQVLRALEGSAVVEGLPFAGRLYPAPDAQLDFAGSATPDPMSDAEREVLDQLRSVDIDRLTPVEALTLLDRLRSRFDTQTPARKTDG